MKKSDYKDHEAEHFDSASWFFKGKVSSDWSCDEEMEATSCSVKLVGRRPVVGVFWADRLDLLRLPLEVVGGLQHFEASQLGAGKAPGPLGQISTQSSPLPSVGW